MRSRSSARRTREGRAENFLVLTYSSRSPGSLSCTATHHLQPCARLQTALALLRCATAHVPRSAPSLLISHPCSRLPKPQLPPSSAVAIRTLDNLLLILRSRLLSGQAPCRLVPPDLAAMRFNRPMLLDHPSVNKRNALLLRPRRVSLPMRDGFRGGLAASRVRRHVKSSPIKLQPLRHSNRPPSGPGTTMCDQGEWTPRGNDRTCA